MATIKDGHFNSIKGFLCGLRKGHLMGATFKGKVCCAVTRNFAYVSVCVVERSHSMRLSLPKAVCLLSRHPFL